MCGGGGGGNRHCDPEPKAPPGVAGAPYILLMVPRKKVLSSSSSDTLFRKISTSAVRLTSHPLAYPKGVMASAFCFWRTSLFCTSSFSCPTRASRPGAYWSARLSALPAHP